MQIRENVLAHAFVLNSQEDIIYILRFSKGQWKLKENINNKNKKDQMKTLMSYQHNSIDFNLISLDSTQLQKLLVFYGRKLNFRSMSLIRLLLRFPFSICSLSLSVFNCAKFLK